MLSLALVGGEGADISAPFLYLGVTLGGQASVWQVKDAKDKAKV